jgi:hypothetical protein
MNKKQESILHSLVNMTTSALVIGYFMTTIPKDGRPIPATIGWMGMGMSWWIFLEGLAGVIAHFSPMESQTTT